MHATSPDGLERVVRGAARRVDDEISTLWAGTATRVRALASRCMHARIWPRFPPVFSQVFPLRVFDRFHDVFNCVLGKNMMCIG